MLELSKFQIECEAELVNALGGDLDERRISGKNELYIHGILPGSNLKIYIYLDGAEVFGEGIDDRFESADYDSLEELRHEFIQSTLRLAEDMRASH